MSINQCFMNSIFALAAVWCVSSAQADLVLRESFDIPVGSLDNQAGATSFGFHPVLGGAWDSGIFGAPDVVAGSITPPASVVSFYNVSPLGNRYSTTNGTVIGRVFDLNGPHFYGSLLTTTSLDPTLTTDALFNFQNFQFRAVNSGTGSFWRMDTFGFADTGANADGTTLVLWELEFNQVGALDTFRIWFNHNPLTEIPDFESSALDLGFNNLGGGGDLGFQSNLFLGLSSLEIDELRIGTDWSSVGVSGVPEPGGIVVVIASSFIAFSTSRRRRNQESDILVYKKSRDNAANFPLSESHAGNSRG
jgi:hypothetical protein